MKNFIRDFFKNQVPRDVLNRPFIAFVSSCTGEVDYLQESVTVSFPAD